MDMVRSRAARTTLTAEDWASAALEVIAEQGVDAISVEGLARRIGVTKGSFYWHFDGRESLVSAALALWEQRATREIIDRLSVEPDPAVRLERLFAETFGGGAWSALDVAVLARVDDPTVREVVHRVTRARIDFLELAYRQLGLTPSRAARQARFAYAAYMGHFQLQRALPDDASITRFDRAYRRQVLAALLPPDRKS